MKNPFFEAKKELIEWVKNLDELETIQELLDLKNGKNSNFAVNESEMNMLKKMILMRGLRIYKI